MKEIALSISQFFVTIFFIIYVISENTIVFTATNVKMSVCDPVLNGFKNQEASNVTHRRDRGLYCTWESNIKLHVIMP